MEKYETIFDAINAYYEQELTLEQAFLKTLEISISVDKKNIKHCYTDENKLNHTNRVNFYKELKKKYFANSRKKH